MAGTTLFPNLIPLGPVPLVNGRCIVALLALAIIARLFAQPLWPGRAAAARMLALGLPLALHWVTFFHALQLAGTAPAVLAFFCFPLLTALLQPLILGGRISGRDLLAGLAMLAGVALIVPDFSLDNRVTEGIAWSLFSAFCYALRNLWQRRDLLGQPAVTTLGWQVLAVVVLTLPFAIDSTPAMLDQAVPLLLLGIAFTALPHALYVHGLMHLNAVSVGLIGYLQPVYATGFAVLAFGNVPGWQTLAGGAVVLAVAGWESLRMTRPTVLPEPK